MIQHRNKVFVMVIQSSQNNNNESDKRSTERSAGARDASRKVGMMSNLNRRQFVGLTALSGAAVVSAGILGGCGSSRAESSGSAGTSEADSSSGSENATSTAPESAPAAAGDQAIAAVFSWSGNTLQVAERVAADAGCELFRIEPAEPYTTDYDEMLQIAQDEQAAGTLPTLAATVPDWESYGTVHLGFPTWWGHLPQIVVSFLSEHDCTGKVVYPFNTHGGSGFASTLSDLASACPGADIREGLSISGDSVASSTDRIDAWVQASV